MQPDFTPVENVPPVAPQESLNPKPPAAPVQPVMVAPPQALPPIHPVRWNRQSSFFAIMLVILAGSVLAIMANPVAMANIRDVAYLLPGMLNPGEKTMLTRSGAVQTPPGTPLPVQGFPNTQPTPVPEYTPPAGWTVSGQAVSPTGLEMAVVMTSEAPGSPFGVTAESVSKLVLVDLNTKQERVLLERPTIVRSDMREGIVPLTDLNDVAWAGHRNSLILTAHDRIEEYSLSSSQLVVHHTDDRSKYWDQMSGYYKPQFWPEGNLVTFHRQYSEGHDVYALQLAGENTGRAVKMYMQGYDGSPNLITVWDRNFVLWETCPVPEGEYYIPCSRVVWRRFPDLQIVHEEKFDRTTDNVNIRQAGGYILAAYTSAWGKVMPNTMKSLEGTDVWGWRIDEDLTTGSTADEDNTFYIKQIGRDKQVKTVVTNILRSPNEGLYWEVMDSGALVVFHVELGGAEGNQAVRSIGEGSYMVGGE